MWTRMSALSAVRAVLRRAVAAAAAVTVLALSTAPAAQAVGPAPVVHSEYVTAGPYQVQVSFSEWPVLADKALDFTFLPDGGIAGHKAALTMYSPAGTDFLHRRNTDHMLRVYTRDHSRWGLDTYQLPAQGTWKLQFTVDGSSGSGTGTLALPVGPRPGPSLTLSWGLALLPLIATIPICFLLWLRGRRNRHANEWVWAA
ncbi:hypothetical protein P3T36_007519 [Kitasatospora sp. MAP12-15]|uniref:hypothetical protein n=1 Tax=unclassified Kitasatospora TaxID=2633591 RepID=UPI002476776A|nr:hypothetical protein [Kitasatospora sp. MAP12-44]MDH6113723.1 hypothetical protein [Kitasatospora sp. MAP12-44]